MESKRRVLVIENQFTQFKEIIRLLDGAGYQVFPTDEKTFKDYLDWIRIFLNPRYDLSRRTLFWEKILQKTIEFSADIFIIDHILVGTHSAEDGIDLAIKFREKGISQPFIFFSRSEMNNIEICDKLPKVLEEKIWIFKGYSGADILEKKFFVAEIIPKIETLLKKQISTLIIEKLNEKKTQKITSATTGIQKEIITETLKLIQQVKNAKIQLSEELLDKLSEDKLESEYLKLLKSLVIKE